MIDTYRFSEKLSDQAYGCRGPLPNTDRKIREKYMPCRKVFRSASSPLVWKVMNAEELL